MKERWIEPQSLTVLHVENSFFSSASSDPDGPQSFKLKMTFGDLTSAAGLKALNTFLADNSYIEG